MSKTTDWPPGTKTGPEIGPPIRPAWAVGAAIVRVAAPRIIADSMVLKRFMAVSLSVSFRLLIADTRVSHDAAPQAFGSPDAGAQTLQLHDLAVVHEKIHFGPIVLDV